MTEKRKYVWASEDFDKWVKAQAKQMRANGIQMGTAGVTHKLLNDVIIPQNITLQQPKMMRKKCLRKARKPTY